MAKTRMPAVFRSHNVAPTSNGGNRVHGTAKGVVLPAYRPLGAARATVSTAAAVVPPLYRPQAGTAQRAQSTAAPVPPLYRSQAAAQAKPTDHSGPHAHRPVVQMVRVKVPKTVKLTGGAGVSVIWTKNTKSDLPHVSVVHKAAGRDGTIDVTNFHYKFSHAGYYNWDEKSGSKTFAFRGGEPSAKIFNQTQKGASKFGVTLEKPASVTAEEALAVAAKESAKKAEKPAAAAKGLADYEEPDVVATSKTESPLLDAWDDEL